VAKWAAGRVTRPLGREGSVDGRAAFSFEWSCSIRWPWLAIFEAEDGGVHQCRRMLFRWGGIAVE
jgi:hypothetical protein